MHPTFSHRARRHSTGGFTMVETLVSSVIVVLSMAGIVMGLVQGWKYLEVSQERRAAVSDLQTLLERFRAVPRANLLATFLHAQPVAEDVRGSSALPDATIVVRYLPGDVSHVIRDGPNTVVFLYAGAPGGSYTVQEAELFITASDGRDTSSRETVSPCVVTAEAPCQATLTTKPDFSTATQVSLRTTLEAVDSAGEVRILVNGQGPYVPGPEFVGAEAVAGEILLPDLRPLRMVAEAQWTSRGRPLLLSLATGRDFGSP